MDDPRSEDNRNTYGRDGRVSNAGIARAVGVSEGTVRRRMKRLIDENLIEVRVILNLGRKARTIVGIHADPQSIDDVLGHVERLDGVTFACVTTGRYDILILGGSGECRNARPTHHQDNRRDSRSPAHRDARRHLSGAPARSRSDTVFRFC